MNIHPEFIDSDLDPPDDVGGADGTGLLEPDRDEFASSGYPRLQDQIDLIPRNRYRFWAERAEPWLRGSIRSVLHQGREGSCVAFSTVGAMTVAGTLQFGARFPDLSPMSLYERIGRSASSGAYIPDGVYEAESRGVLPADSGANREVYSLTYPMTGYNPRRLARIDWEPVARDFRIASVYRVASVAEWFTATIHGWPVVYGRRSHAIYSVLPKYDQGRLYFGYVNSWGQWGDVVNDSLPYGMGWDSEATIANCTGYAVAGVVSDSGGRW